MNNRKRFPVDKVDQEQRVVALIASYEPRIAADKEQRLAESRPDKAVEQETES